MNHKIISLVLVLCLTFVFFGCSKKQETEFEVSSIEEISVEKVLPDIDNTTLYDGKTLYEYHEENEDTIGWIKIPGTKTDNVVMLGREKAYGSSSTEDVNYYLNHSFDGRNTTAGEIYIDFRSDITAEGMNQNMVFYGHHMMDGTMLAGLDKFKSKSFLEEHQYVEFNTLWEKHHYKVFTVFTVDLKTEYGLAFDYRQPNYTGDDFTNFKKEIKDRQYFDTGVDFNEDSKIITLSTCTYPTGNSKTDNARLVVMARMCTEEEEAMLASE